MMTYYIGTETRGCVEPEKTPKMLDTLTQAVAELASRVSVIAERRRRAQIDPTPFIDAANSILSWRKPSAIHVRGSTFFVEKAIGA